MARQIQAQSTGVSRHSWQYVIGLSGTVHCTKQNLLQQKNTNYISAGSLPLLATRILKARRIDKLALQAVSSCGLAVLSGGVAVLYGFFEALSLEDMQVIQA